MTPLDASIATLKGVQKKYATVLRSMGIETVKDLIFYFPYRYDDFSLRVPINEMIIGSQVTLTATVQKVNTRRSFRRRMTMTEAVLSDESGELIALWFHQPYLAKTLSVGTSYRFAGKIAQTKFGRRLLNPLREAVEKEGSAYVQPLMPVYSVSSGINQHAIRTLIRSCEPLMRDFEDTLPEVIRKKYALFSFCDALIGIHFPQTKESSDAARRRIGFDELLRLQLVIGRTRHLRSVSKASAIVFDEGATKNFVTQLPFILTNDQRKAAWAILKDMAKTTPMHRLLDGDVGSGKTVVAAIATMNVALAKHQSAVMAPTEILARQHFETFKKMFRSLPIAIALWTNAYKRSAFLGKETVCTNKKEIEYLRDEIANGTSSVIIGTHALVEDSLPFSSLVFAVIDEQHRFGVRIRQLLCKKSGALGCEPHLLSMTATPIPRSLALTIFGDLDLSLLQEKPKGRKEILTKIIEERDRKKMFQFLRKEINEGRQVFFVCPLIDPSDALGVSSVSEAHERLSKDEFSDMVIGMLHGKMSAEEKETVMRDFVEKKIHILVSTSVIEVGVDIPNATVMCIEGAERFGISQLHQFRGRIGRGEHQSFCFLMPSTNFLASKERLETLVSCRDGFTLAEKDLAMRGAGDLLGVAQSGFPTLRIASLTDFKLIEDAKEAAAEILAQDPDLRCYPELHKYITESVEKVHLE